MAIRPALTLATTFTKAADGKPATYGLELTNQSDTTVSDFTLCFIAPTRVDLEATFDNATLKRRSSNFVEIAPPDGFVLEPGGRWKTATASLGRDLQHWSDGANAAYLAFADGSTVPIESVPTTLTGDNAPLKRGTEPFPVPGPGKAPAPISVVPWPNLVAIESIGDTPAGLAVQATGEAAKAASVFADLAQSLFPADGLIRPVAEGGLPVSLATDAGQKPEAYRIAFAADHVTVHAGGHAGWLYGLVTLGQILRGARRHPLTFGFPTSGEITDAPAFGWRGSHLDVSRQFYSTAEVQQFLKIMAWNKLNRFHWHLTDDEGWRVEIDAYPELTDIGAWRGHGLPLPPLFGTGAARNGGYYTKEAIRQTVSLAETLAIDVVPEIDVPGHSFAAIVALPWLSDPDETGAYYFHDNFPNACLNPAYEPVYEFVEKMFGELLELFPSKTFHVGADEVPEGAWEGSPLARAMNEKIGGVGPEKLQAAFLRRVQAFLTQNGRITGAWEEAALGGGIDKAHAYLVGWKSVEVSAELAGEGYDIVMAPGQRYYLDMANGAQWSEPGASWAGWSGPEETYTFEPGEGWTEAQREHLWGVQACIWSEHLTDRAIFDRLVFPRLSAIAETGWTAKDKKSWERFKSMAGLLPNLYGYWSE
ncbi:beta-N-acetylhexosaminidase [Devosia nitrariae]|uniref:beta-N-acetylhexosaminidase n=1 Tax=Devosia nitrariae TaxID=2071872 RepID=A0ABQ5W2V7_9HYPH|nr:beta-N-acetylhexosaminidase [Devosia nitrariae]GLQ54399.1 beta-N-acetylhexosaminidase [Devosia nitrariae]